MARAFKQGVLVGVFAPLAFLAGLVLWVYRYTGMVPFPTRRSEHGEVVIRLVDPGEVPKYWQGWRRDLEPVVGAVRDAFARARERIAAPEA